jgi:hypothetical protein
MCRTEPAVFVIAHVEALVDTPLCMLVFVAYLKVYICMYVCMYVCMYGTLTNVQSRIRHLFKVCMLVFVALYVCM